MLSFDTAINFVQTSLGVKDVEKKYSEDKHKLLEEIIRAFFRELPFQTISLLAPPPEKRHLPTEVEIISNGLSLKGGVCLDLNYFMTLLLQALGYDAYPCLGSPGHEGYIHVLVVVKNLKTPGDRFLVDVGCGYPTFSAVPLDQLPYTLVNCGLEMKFIREGNKYFRLHRKGDVVPAGEKVMKGEWRQIFEFDLEPRQYNELAEPLTSLYCGDLPEKTFFHKDLHAVRFPGHSEKTVYALGNTIITRNENAETVGQPMVFSSMTEMEDDLLSIFPNLNSLEVRPALSRLEKTKQILASSKSNTETV